MKIKLYNIDKFLQETEKVYAYRDSEMAIFVGENGKGIVYDNECCGYSFKAGEELTFYGEDEREKGKIRIYPQYECNVPQDEFFAKCEFREVESNDFFTRRNYNQRLRANYADMIKELAKIGIVFTEEKNMETPNKQRVKKLENLPDNTRIKLVDRHNRDTFVIERKDIKKISYAFTSTDNSYLDFILPYYIDENGEKLIIDFKCFNGTMLETGDLLPNFVIDDMVDIIILDTYDPKIDLYKQFLENIISEKLVGSEATYENHTQENNVWGNSPKEFYDNANSESLTFLGFAKNPAFEKDTQYAAFFEHKYTFIKKWYHISAYSVQALREQANEELKGANK